MNTKSKSVAETSFSEALAHFRSFLDEQGETEPIVWTFVEDVRSRKTNRYETDFWIKLPIPQENESLARDSFKVAQKRGLGMAITAFARCKDGLCCTIMMPKDEEDAQYSMMSPAGIRYILVNELTIATDVTSRISWWLMGLLFFRYRHGNYLVYLNTKSDPR